MLCSLPAGSGAALAAPAGWGARLGRLGRGLLPWSPRRGPGDGPRPRPGLGSLADRLEAGRRAGRVNPLVLRAHCCVYFAQWASRHRLTAWACKHNGALKAGQLWRLVTPTLVHANLAHLGASCLALLTLGGLAEDLVGPERYALTYALSGAAGNVASYLFNPLPAVGSSGAIFGLAGALAVFAARHHWVEEAPGARAQLLSIAGLNLAYGVYHPNIDNFGHAGGLVAGAAFAYVFGPNLERRGEGPGGVLLADAPPVKSFAFKRPVRLHPRGGWGARKGPTRRPRACP